MIAKECYHIVLIPFIFLVFFGILTFFESFFVIPLVISALLQVFFLFFFRDFPRYVYDGIVSPADGRVVLAEDNIVFIFMNLFDQHVNLMPYDGRIINIKHHLGHHAPAFGDTSSNERVVMEIECSFGNMRIEQVAGAVARRIVTYVREGDILRKGEKIGIIRFGSRVEVFLGKKCEITIAPGQKIRAGQTIAKVKIKP